MNRIEIGKTELFTERLLAALIDFSITMGLSLFPRVGWIFGLIYFLFKDSIVLLDGQSFGRRLFKIKVVTRENGQSLIRKPDKALVRQLILLIPLLNLVELYRFLFLKDRFGAKWTQTTVVKVD